LSVRETIILGGESDDQITPGVSSVGIAEAPDVCNL
jgi:hypothetical protein